MSLDVIKFAFIAGELSPKLHGRPDLEKFDLGLALSYNWFVDYHGGISTRPGLEFIDYIKRDDVEVIAHPFKFNADIANTYIVLFGHLYVRFIQDGAYVLEANKGGSEVDPTNPARVTVPAHGYVNGDWIKMDGRTFIVASKTADTFALHDPFGANIDNTDGSMAAFMTCARIYTVASPYSSDDLADLHVSQRKDILRLTHKDFPPYDLMRNSHTSWPLTQTVFGNTLTPPNNLTGAPFTAGTFGFVWCVTQIDQNGVESSINGLQIEDGTNNYTSVAGGYTFLWNAPARAKYFNVYRSNIVNGADANRGQEVGFIARTYGPKHQELNTVPDFVRTPPINQNPFAPGQILSIDVTNAGSGYTAATAVHVSGGTGFLGYAIVNASGAIIGVVVLKGGTGYTDSSVVTFTVGSGATADVDAGPATGTYPTLSARFQQREIYAATINEPLTIFGSRPGDLGNFDVSRVIADDDAYSHEIDSDEVTPIRHILSMRSGLLILTGSGVWQLTGGGQNDAVTPTNALADPHSYTGVNKVPPLKIDADLVYQEAKGACVRMLSYNDVTKVYAGVDVSILSSHFFSGDNQLIAWSYADSPYKTVWGTRSDGAMLAFTIVREQNIYAWTQHWTRGYFQWNVSIQEDLFDRTYVITQRVLHGRYSKFVERFSTRQFKHVEDAFCVDAGLSLTPEYPNATITLNGTFIGASSAIFHSDDVGKILRVHGGKFLVTAYLNSTNIEVQEIRAADEFIPETTSYSKAVSGTWTLDTPVSSVSGLWHLEGETVSILADGNVLPQQVVEDGSVTFPTLVTATRVIVGLPYRCKARLLPLTIPNNVVEGQRKRITAAALRLDESRGVKVGVTLDKLYAMKERTTEPVGEPTELVSRIMSIPTQSVFNEDGSLYFVVDDPLPATILGVILSTEIGDDPS